MQRVLAFDPGAKRMGYAVVEGDGVKTPFYVFSDVEEILRGKTETYQAYRTRLIGEWAIKTDYLLTAWTPDIVVYETLPVKGFHDMSQALLAATAITAMHTIAITKQYVPTQVAAVTVKVCIAGSNKATKVGVRKGVQRFLPELDKPGWPAFPDESDAVAIGLTALGYKI